MVKTIDKPYAWGVDGRDRYVDEALNQHLNLLTVEVSGMCAHRENIYHILDYGVTLKHIYSSHRVSITLYGSETNIGEVEKIVHKAIEEGLRKFKRSTRIKT